MKSTLQVLGVALAILAVIVCLSTSASAQTTGPYSAYGGDGGVFLVGASGTVMYCSGNTSVTGAGANETVAPAGLCAVLGQGILTPTTDKWVGIPVSGNFSIYFLDTDNGHMFECAALNNAVTVVGGGTRYYVSGRCASFGDVTP